MISKKFRNKPWCIYIIPMGEKGEFFYDKKMKIGDTGLLLMNVNLFENNIKNAIWGKFKITKIIHANYYEGIRIK